MEILVVDDLAETRIVLKALLQRQGHSVITACDGEEAYNILDQNPQITFVISDWNMPKIEGPELCDIIRRKFTDRYIYYILLTAKNEKDEIVAGMEAGADDFISKPFDKEELKVRIKAGERILSLKRDLDRQNKQLADYNHKLIKDLKAAAILQQSLLPSKYLSFGNVNFSGLFFPSTFIGGDSLNYFRLTDHHLGFYILDVAGHGAAAAMLAFSLNKNFSFDSKSFNPILLENHEKPIVKSPDQVLTELNAKSSLSTDSMSYFTMVYGVIDQNTMEMELSFAGHPAGLLITGNGERVRIGDQSFPVGMFDFAEYTSIKHFLTPGDVLLFFSDGVFECKGSNNTSLTEEEIAEFIINNRGEELKGIADKFEQFLTKYNNTDSFSDDVSVLFISISGSLIAQKQLNND